MSGMLTRKHLDRSVYDLAKERIAIALDQFDHVIVSFSGGKDSTAVLNMVLEVAHSDPRYARHLPLRVVHADEECIPIETEEYVRRTAQRDDVALEWYCLPLAMRNACSRKHPKWWCWAPEDEERWARPLPPEAITRLDGFPTWPAEARISWPQTAKLLTPPHLGNTCVFMGIRADESITRTRVVSTSSKSREYNWLIPYAVNDANDGASSGNAWKAYPIYDWSTKDVWTAPAKLGWDVNEAYNLMAMAGISPSQQRCSPAFGEEPMEKLWVYAQAFPDVWAKMVERVPGVGAAYRYARTELYGYGKPGEKPAGLSWPEYIHHYVALHPDSVRAEIAARVGTWIRRHYHKTTDPILPHAAHPTTCITWNFLLRIGP
jgi:predicted phosphoadenosine phosphosulfate sulfurtransferase